MDLNRRKILGKTHVALLLALMFGSLRSAVGSPEVIVDVLSEPGWVAVQANCAEMLPLPVGSSVEVCILDKQGIKTVARKVEQIQQQVTVLNVVVNAVPLQPGDYRARTVILSADGSPIGEPVEKPVAWPGQADEFKGVKILNNVVWELLNLEQTVIDGAKTYRFKSPKRRWVYVAVTAQATGGGMRMSLGQYKDIISLEKGEKATKESMRVLPAGNHELTVSAAGDCQIERLVIRSIPEILLHEYGNVQTFNADLGMSELEFYDKYVVNHVNVFITAPDLLAEDHPYFPKFKKWKRRGGKVLVGYPAKGTPDIGQERFSAEQAYEYLSTRQAITKSIVDGLILDEFVGYDDPSYSNYAKAIRQLSDGPKFKNKPFYAYVATLHSSKHGRALVKSIMDAGGVMAWERYLSTKWDKYLPQPSDVAARNYLQTEYGLVQGARYYRERCPGSMEQMAICFGVFSVPGGETLRTTPYVNYKAWLDMQFNVVANNPMFWGTYGLMGYHSDYTDEEILRWTCHLFRHYGIEGSTEPATNDPYISPHLVNGDFGDGVKGWKIIPAKQGSIHTASMPGLSEIQKRVKTSEGDTGLVMTRSENKPNRITQEIRDLQPGRLYTFRMMSCDYEDVSKRVKQAVSIQLENVTVIPDKSFTAIIPSASYVDIKTNDTWLNYYSYQFRANGQSARVTVTDWSSEQGPGGPIGQQLMFNFLQVQPYYAPEAD